MMSWYGVNFLLGVGLHAYGFGAGGQMEVGSASWRPTGCSWYVVRCAYRVETSGVRRGEWR